MRQARPATLAALVVLSFAAGWLVLGGAALGMLLPGWLLFLAWRFDNHTGSLLLLATLFVTVIAILVLLIGLMALAAAH